MRTYAALLAATSLASLTLGSILAACGGDSGTQASPGDSGPDSPALEAGPEGGGGPIQIGARDLKIYLGQTAKPDASQTMAGGQKLGYVWTLKSLPTGSNVTSSSIVGESTATPSFVPDVAGDYVLTLTATAGANTASKDVKVSAFAASVFFTQARPNANPPYMEMQAVGADGVGAHALSCRLELAIDGGADADNRGTFIFLSLFLGVLGVDSWEAPAGQPSRVAFGDFKIYPDGGSQIGLAVGTTESSCQNPPQTVRVVTGNGASTLQPQFSRDGNKIAFIESTSSTTAVATVAYDGSNYHHVSDYCQGVDSGSCTPGYASRPQWLDNDTRVGWIEATSSTTWRIVAANDATGATIDTLLSCTGEAPRQFARLADGTFLTSYRQTTTLPIDLVVVRAGAAKQCEIVRNLTKFAGAGSRARDFAVSPDGTQVVYLSHEGTDASDNETGSGGVLYVASVDGTGTPLAVPGQAGDGPVGARWIAGGSALAWTRIDPTKQDAGASAAIVSVVPVRGGAIKDVVRGDNATFVISAGNGGCSVVGGGAGMAAAFGAAVAGMIALLRRRRR